MRLIISGGHLTPAYCFIEYCQKNSDTVLMLGSGSKSSREATEMRALRVEYRHIEAVKLDRNRKIQSFLMLPKLLVPVYQSMTHLRTFRPQAVVLFGGYNAVALGLAAWFLHVPIIMHEQTVRGGLGSQLLKHIARFCAVSYSTSLPFFPKRTTRVTGNLIRSSFWNPPQSFSSSHNNQRPMLYVTGGNQGSRAILVSLGPLLEELTTKYQLIIQFGQETTIEPIANKFGIQASSWFSAEDTAYLMHHSRMVITRSGANTTAEIMVAGVPSICVPLPNSSRNEQLENARLLSSNGASITIDQANLNTNSLRDAIQTIESNYDRYKENASQLKSLQHHDANKQLYTLVKQSLNQ